MHYIKNQNSSCLEQQIRVCDLHNSIREWRLPCIKEWTLLQSEQPPKGACHCRTCGAEKCAREAKKEKVTFPMFTRVCFCQPLCDPSHSHEITKQGLETWSRTPGYWFASTKGVNLKPSSQRGLSCFRSMCAGKHTKHGCDSFTWVRPHTCL